MKKVHLIMPMAGEGSRFKREGITTPKPLVDLNGKPFFYWSVVSILKDFSVEDISFVVLDKHIRNNEIDKKIVDYFPDAKIYSLDHVLDGPVFTCLKGVEQIKDDNPIIFNDCDHMFRSTSFARALAEENEESDAVLLSFYSNFPQYSYVKYHNGKIVGTVEKKVVSNDAICGAYYFLNKETFCDAASKYVQNCEYSECFMSGIYNVLCAEGKKVSKYTLDYHVEFGTPEELELAKQSERFNDFSEE